MAIPDPFNFRNFSLIIWQVLLIIIKDKSSSLKVTSFAFTMEDYEFCFLNVYSHFIGSKPRSPFFKLSIDLIHEFRQVFSGLESSCVIREQQRF
jgi:hypothetical protein